MPGGLFLSAFGSPFERVGKQCDTHFVSESTDPSCLEESETTALERLLQAA
jgi:hypothetical protein